MREVIYVVIALIMSIGNLKVNNEVIIESSIQQVENVELGTFFCSKDGILISYTSKNEKTINRINQYLDIVPAEVKKGIKQIVLLPNSNGNVAGITKNETIYLYDYEQYSVSTQKRIIWHEVGHIWGNYLMQMKLLDYDYTDYFEAVRKDNNYITEYSKKYILDKQRYSEDFADAVAEYLLNKDIFVEKHENRAKYIQNLIKKQKEIERKDNL